MAKGNDRGLVLKLFSIFSKYNFIVQKWYFKHIFDVKCSEKKLPENCLKNGIFYIMINLKKSLIGCAAPGTYRVQTVTCQPKARCTYDNSTGLAVVG